MTDVHLKLTVLVGERARHGDRFVADALLDLCSDAGTRSAVVLRGSAGFGPRHELRTDMRLSLSEDPPIAVIAVDSAEHVTTLAEEAVQIVPRGAITLERVLPADADTTAGEDVELSVYTGRAQQALGRPAHVAVCDALHRHGFASATSFAAVDGVVHGRRRRARFFGRNGDVPVLTVAVGRGFAAAGAVAELRTLLGTPFMTVAPAQLCARGESVRRPMRAPATDTHGRTVWQKVIVHTSEADLHDGVPIHRALVRRLRDSPTTAGVTVMRGVWGFAGDAEPRGDRVFQVGRHVPVTTEFVDTPERIAAHFDVVDEITAGVGVISSVLVPAMVAIDEGRPLGSLRLADPGQM